MKASYLWPTFHSPERVLDRCVVLLQREHRVSDRSDALVATWGVLCGDLPKLLLPLSELELLNSFPAPGVLEEETEVPVHSHELILKGTGSIAELTQRAHDFSQKTLVEDDVRIDLLKLHQKNHFFSGVP